MSSLLAAQERGRASATLGQVRNFADVVVFWGVDPALRYPRYCVAVCAGAGRTSRRPTGAGRARSIAVDIGDRARTG